MTPAGDLVPLSSVARLETRRGIDAIRHHDGQPAVRVSAHVDPARNSAFAILRELEVGALPDLRERYGVQWGLAGKSRDDARILGTLKLGALLTLALIYLILAWVFASYAWPIAIMTAIPFAMTGAILGHWAMGMDIGAFSLLAFFALTGIVVNDSIVLVGFFRRELERGTPALAALERAAVARFRAVVLTSVTTIAGLAPLAFEPSSLAIYIAPIAVTICFGLALATALVLLVVPALLVLIDAGTDRLLALATRPATPVTSAGQGARP